MFDHPEWYVGDPGLLRGDTEFKRQLQRLRNGSPEDEITVYRSMPPEVGGQINRGDWVALTYKYAQEHGFDAEDETLDWPVYATKVKLKDLYTEGNELNEWGFHGEPGVKERVDGPVS